MRVAIVSECFLPTVNGVTNTVLRVIEHLAARGHRVLLVAPGQADPGVEGVTMAPLPSVALPVVNSMPVGLPSYRLTRALRAFRPDVVHLAAPFVVGARGLAVARRMGIPTVAVYQTDVAGFATSYRLGLTAATAWRWTCRLHRLADRTLAPSSWAIGELRARGVPRVHRWARGVDLTRFHPARRDPDLRAELAPRGELLVGYVGRLAPEKQVRRLVALAPLAARVPMRIVIVGDGPSQPRLRQELAAAGLDAVFLGFRAGDELARIYASLDVFVHTGPSETYCQTVQEALACGVPVVAPDAGGPRDLVEHGGTGYLVPVGRPDSRGAYDPDDAGSAARLRAAVAALADPQHRRVLGRAARRSVAGRDWAAVCDQLIRHYREVAAGGGAATGRVA